MIILLLNNYISTETILKISDIIKPRTDEFDDSEDSNDYEFEWLYRFEITHISNLTDIITIDDVNGNLDKLVEIHYKLIKEWSNHQPKILNIT